MSKTITIRCPKHGAVEFAGVHDLGRVSTMYCPKCVDEAHNPHQHPSSPYPVQGTSPSVIESCNRGD